jgi:uncharacterized DUF497 family protein
MYNKDIIFEWDEGKNRKNFLERGISFEAAETVFQGEILTFEDNRHDYGEARYITLGRLAKRLVVIVYTIRENRIRIISMRKANAHEQKNYQQKIAQRNLEAN